GGPVGLYEYATIKYDKSQGRELWVARYHGQQDQDEAAALAADAEGNVYVTGMGDQRCRMGEKYVRCFAGNYVTVKYGNEGTEQWVARYSPWEGTHRATAIVVDSGGNLYVTGTSGGVETISDYATIKYDQDGHPLWVARYCAEMGGISKANAV